MREEILINVTPQETRVSVVENGVLQEVHLERIANRGVAGNIYKGIVTRVMPGMQAAFVDIGLDKAAFLHAADIFMEQELDSTSEQNSEDSAELQDITNLIRVGQKILVQVIKDPISTKGARLTTHITIPSRYLVLMPEHKHIGVSQRIEEDDERQRLKEILKASCTEDYGYIVRTAAEKAEKEELTRDSLFLQKLWSEIQLQEKKVRSPGLVHEDLPLELRIMRDLLAEDIERVWIDDEATFKQLSKFVKKFTPALTERLEAYNGERPIFDLYNIEEEIHKALERKVQLKSGGYLVVDQTEAMTTIDVNTGAFVGHKTLEETIFRTNLEAANALARQLRLRNLGGIIIVDFIDMQDAEHKRQVLRTLEKALDRDHVKTQITEVSVLGLVEMTRKRTRESLEQLMCEPCQYCNGRGFIKTAVTICYEIFREISRSSRAYDVQKLLVLASEDVVECMLDEEASSLAELEDAIGKPIRLQAEPLYGTDQYDVVLI